MIEINDVSKTYLLGKTEVEALKKVDLKIEKGTFTCLMGPSGSGKSTLLNLIGCLDSPNSGSILIDGVDIVKLSRKKLADTRANKIGFIFQAFNLIPVLNVFENIEFPLFIKKDKLKESEKKERILKLIEEVGLTDFIHHKPDELSGGQRQRVAIARAMVTEPDIILADEPTANLDSVTGQNIISLMQKLKKEENTTFLLATHEKEITQSADRLIHLKDGKIIEG